MPVLKTEYRYRRLRPVSPMPDTHQGSRLYSSCVRVVTDRTDDFSQEIKALTHYAIIIKHRLGDCRGNTDIASITAQRMNISRLRPRLGTAHARIPTPQYGFTRITF
ncbi:hypothetical protein J6590_065771 [Homalodisca vitripennis]|nr:hypothetical protein J6590_065771 [Homalodisca vitripennis]